MLTDIPARLESWLWDRDLQRSDRPVRYLVRLLRFVYASVRDLLGQQLTLRAMSLVYTTLLSVVPLLAFSFAILKGMNVHRRLEPVIANFVAPLGPRGEELTRQVISFVDNVQGGLLGSIGLLFLIYTVISMVQKIEGSFNYVWRVDRPRSFARRFSEYLSVIVVAPILMVFSATITATVRSTTIVQQLSEIEPFGTGLILAGKITPYIVVSLVFTFIYVFVPNTRVRARAALVGGFTAGVLWAAVGALFASVVVYSTRTFEIYGFFAIVLMAMIWLYLNWLILLLGAQVAFYYQHPEFLRVGRRQLELANAIRERLALTVMLLIGRDFRNDQRRWTTNSLASYLDLPGDVLGNVVSELEAEGLVVATEEDVLMPGRDMDAISLKKIIDAVRERRPSHGLPRINWLDEVEEIAATIDAAISDRLDRRTLRDLVQPRSSQDKPAKTG